MYYFIINPHSRSGHGLVIWRELEQILKNRQIPYQAHLTEYVGHARKIARTLSDTDTPRTIVALGGDGTVNEVLDGLNLSSPVTFGYIPTGSGNDFARGMHLPTNPRQALECILKEANIRKIDVGHITTDGKSHRFGVSAGIGYDANVCCKVTVSPLKKLLNRLHLGKLGYILIGLKELMMYHPSPMTLYLDDNRRFFYEKAYFIAAMNQPCEGGGLRFAPKAAPDDHMIDICVAANLPKWKILCLIPLVFFGKHTGFKGIYMHRCKSMTVHSAVPLPVHRDGESGGYRSELRIILETSPLKVIIPVI